MVILTPSEIIDRDWITEIDTEIASKYQFPPEERGFWIIIHLRTILDQKWSEAVELYRAGKLTGIRKIQLSTSSPLGTHSKTGVIIFECGPASDENLVNFYGQNLIEKMPEANVHEAIYFQTDLETLKTINGSRRILTEYVYWISHKMPVRVQGELIEKPSETFDVTWIIEENDEIAAKYDYPKSEGGKWMMFFTIENLDEKWKQAVEFYRAGKLTGIKYLKVSTMVENPRARDPETSGVILFFCGPANDQKLMKSYGYNLLQKVPYDGFDGGSYMAFKTQVQSEIGTFTTGEQRNCAFSISTRIVFDGFRILEEEILRPEIAPKSDKENGFWIMFYPIEVLTRIWKQALKLYKFGKLTGIRSIRVTSEISDRTCTIQTGAILFHCGPIDDKSQVISYGNNLLREIEYFHELEYFVSELTLNSNAIYSIL